MHSILNTRLYLYTVTCVGGRNVTLRLEELREEKVANEIWKKVTVYLILNSAKQCGLLKWICGRRLASRVAHRHRLIQNFERLQVMTFGSANQYSHL